MGGAARRPTTLMPTIRRCTPAFASDAARRSASSRKLGLTTDRDPVARPRRGEGARPARHRPRLDGGRERRRRSRTRSRSCSRVRASLVQVTNLGHHASRTARRTRSSSSPAWTTARRSRARASRSFSRDNSLLWTGTTGADGVAIGPGSRSQRGRRLRRLRRVAAAALHRHRREGRRHRLRRQQLERGHRAVGLQHLVQSRAKPIRCCAARSSAIAASTGSARRCTSRRSCARTRRTGIRLLRSRHAGLRHRSRQPVPRRRRADRDGQRVEQRRVDADAAGGGRARQLLGARDSRERPAEAAPPDQRATWRDARAPKPTSTCRIRRSVNGSFLVAAYRRPDFRVDVTLTGDGRSPASR